MVMWSLNFFGYTQNWQASYELEKAAQEVLMQSDVLAVPKLLASGNLYANRWSYLVTTRMPGESWEHAELTVWQREMVATDLGAQIGQIHALEPQTGLGDMRQWGELDLVAAARKSSFPTHLIPGIRAYVASISAPDMAFVHGDLMERHIFIANGRLSGVIDWGDAAFQERHYELAKLHLDLFDCDKQLLARFLEASEWTVTADFAHKALVYAIYRQAHGLVQHHTMDVFFKLPKLFDLEKIATIEELADILFKIE